MGYSYDHRTAAAADSLLTAKVEWAQNVAENAAQRFKSYGGWRQHQVKTNVRVSSRGSVELTVRSEKYKWTGFATFEMEGESKVVASVSLDDNTEDDLVKMLERFQDAIKEIPIEDVASSDNVVLQISLWFSQTVNKIPVA